MPWSRGAAGLRSAPQSSRRPNTKAASLTPTRFGGLTSDGTGLTVLAGDQKRRLSCSSQALLHSRCIIPLSLSWRVRHERAANTALMLSSSNETASAYLNYLGIVARDELVASWELVEKVAGALVAKHALTAAEIAALFRWRRKNRGLAGLATTAPLHRWAIHTAMSASDRETVPDDGRQPTNERKRK